MTNLKDQFYKASNRIQDGVLYLILEAAICLTFALFDVYHDKYIWTQDWSLGPEWCFVIRLLIIFAITLCGLGILYGMKAGWVGSVIMAIVLMAIGIMLMLDLVYSSLTLSGLFYFIFGAIALAELVRKDFRIFCGIGQSSD